jgi:hypothetical protein
MENDTQKHRQQNDLISLVVFVQNKESRLKTSGPVGIELWFTSL